MSRRIFHWTEWLVLLSALAARAVVSILTQYQVDDAMITFRYAENLAGGLGFVYNAGEHVLGTTSPLWTLFLALAGKMHAAVPAVAFYSSLIISGFTAVLVYRLARTLGAGSWALTAGLLYALHPRSVTVDICGLEVAVFTFMLVSAVYRLRQGKNGESLLWAACATLTRPEGTVVLLGVLAVVIAQRRSIAISGWIMTAVLVLGWIGFSTMYFGSPIPNSVAAKVGLYSAATVSVLQRTSEMMLLTNPVSWLIWLGAILATTLSARRRAIIHLSIAVSLIYVIGIAWGSPRIFFWYPAPLIPLLSVLAAVGAKSLMDRLAGASRERFSKTIAAASAFILAAIFTLGLYARIPVLREEMSWYNSTHIAAAAFLSAAATGDDTVLAEDIGHFGYHYRGRIVDRDGLVTPAAIAYNRRQEYFALVDSVNPDWIFLAADFSSSKAILSDARFHERYTRTEYSENSASATHVLYRRWPLEQSP